MYLKASLLVCVALLQNVVSGYKFLLLNDMHLNISATEPYPKIGEALTPELMIDMILDAKAQVDSEGVELDAIILNGDTCRHGLASRVVPTNETGPAPKWPEMMATMRTVVSTIISGFPNTPIIFSVGNNDVMYHDQAPTVSQAP